MVWSRLHCVSEEKWDSFSEKAHQMLRKYTTTMPAPTITAPSASLGARHQLAAGPPPAHQLHSWQWPQPQQQQQQPVMPTPQWQQWPQLQQPQWPHAQQQPAHQQPTLQQSTKQQSTGQQTKQPDIQRPARSHCTPVQSVRQVNICLFTNTTMKARGLSFQRSYDSAIIAKQKFCFHKCYI